MHEMSGNRSDGDTAYELAATTVSGNRIVTKQSV